MCVSFDFGPMASVLARRADCGRGAVSRCVARDGGENRLGLGRGGLYGFEVDGSGDFVGGLGP